MGCFWLEPTIIIEIEPHPFYPILCVWFRWGWSNFFLKKNLYGQLIKTEIFKTANFQSFCAKISGIGPWVYRINWYDEHGCGSTHMVIRLSERRPLHRKKGQNFCFIPIEIRHKLWCRMDGTYIFMIIVVSSQKQPTPNILGGSVCIQIL